MGKKKIFVGDDEEEILGLLKNLLVSKGFDVMTSGEPKNMFGQIKSFQPDLIMLDLLMPELGGFEICQMLNSDPWTQSIPIIIVSALDDKIDVKTAYKLGVVGYFSKPFDLNLLITEINKEITNKENKP